MILNTNSIEKAYINPVSSDANCEWKIEYLIGSSVCEQCLPFTFSSKKDAKLYVDTYIYNDNVMFIEINGEDYNKYTDMSLFNRLELESIKQGDSIMVTNDESLEWKERAFIGLSSRAAIVTENLDNGHIDSWRFFKLKK